MRDFVKNITISIAFPATILLVSPITMALGNRSEFPQGLTNGPVLVFCIVSCAVLAMVWLAQKFNATAYKVLTALLACLGLCAWIQSQLLVWDFGPLDGRGLPWEKFQTQSIIELAIWAAGIALAAFLSRRRKELTFHIATAVLLLGSGSLLSAYATAKEKGEAHSRKISYIAEQDAFRFHPSSNTIMLVLDTFQSDAFNEIATRYPSEVDFLRGFQFFPDAVGGYPTTRHSIPLILTGGFYTNQEPHTQRYLIKNLGSSVIAHYQNADYRTAGSFYSRFSKDIAQSHTNPVAINPAITSFNYLGLSRSEFQLIDIGLFRAAPILLKKIIYDEGRWTLTEAAARKQAGDQYFGPSWQGNDLRVVNSFLKHARIDSADSGAFIFIHLMGAHPPISIDENYRYVPGLRDTRENYINQARGVLKLAGRLLEKLEKLDIYKDAEIIIVGDHGAHNKAPADMLDSDIDFDQPIEVIGAARPVFLYKRAGNTAPLSINNTPVHLADIACLLKLDCKSHIQTGSPPPKVRYHYRYEWSHEFWFKDYSPPMTLYEVIGDARKHSSWSNTGQVFSEGGVAIVRHNSYAANEIIDFGQSGNSGELFSRGISGQEPEYRWSNGDIAVITLNTDHEIKAPAWLHVRGIGFSPDGGSSPQRTKISLNDHALGEWEFPQEDTTIKVKLPNEVLDTKTIRLRFTFERPTAPCAISESDDCRVLGIAFKQLSIITK